MDIARAIIDLRRRERELNVLLAKVERQAESLEKVFVARFGPRFSSDGNKIIAGSKKFICGDKILFINDFGHIEIYDAIVIPGGNHLRLVSNGGTDD